MPVAADALVWVVLLMGGASSAASDTAAAAAPSEASESLSCCKQQCATVNKHFGIYNLTMLHDIPTLVCTRR